MKKHILIAEDDETFRSFLQTILEDNGYEVQTTNDGLKGLRLLRQKNFDLVISDMNMPNKSGLEMFRNARNEASLPPFIFLTAFGKIDEAVAAIKEGAVDYLTKPLDDPDILLALVDRTLGSINKTRERLLEHSSAGLPPEELIFAGRAMKEIQHLVHNVAATNTTVLIHGESGTGKELVARTIHLLSPRSTASFIPLNCAAIPENLLESELFGHEKGAFTGAVQTRLGKFELAMGGTIFLDEIGEMPLALQSKLLRVLQERVFERVGGNKETKVDVRIIAATNRNLQNEVSQGRFREDLYYRLDVFPLHLPPLRERLDAIPLLTDYFLNRFSLQIGKKLKGIETSAMEAMEAYSWPGNIRELQNIIERVAILAQDFIRLDNLPSNIVRENSKANLDNKEILKMTEREIILKALRKHRGNRRLTAVDLKISQRKLYYRLKEYGLLKEP